MRNTIYILSLLDKCSEGDDCALVLTFQATGCPNEKPSQPQMAWWKKQSDHEVFSDMFAYCNKIRDRKANQRQRLECCGEGNRCTQISCNKQTAWTTGNNAFFLKLHTLEY